MLYFESETVLQFYNPRPGEEIVSVEPKSTVPTKPRTIKSQKVVIKSCNA